MRGALIQLARVAILVPLLSALGCGAPEVGVYAPLSDDVLQLPIEIGCDQAPSAPITLHGAQLVGTQLRLAVSHSGGCAAHSYRVCGAARLAEDDPGRWPITVLHQTEGDSCEGLIHRVLEVDLARNRPFDVSELHERSLVVSVR